MVLTDVISSIGEAGLAAVTGYLVVFFGIALLMAVMAIMGKVMQSAQKSRSRLWSPLPQLRRYRAASQRRALPVS